MASQRDKDYHKLRNPEMYDMTFQPWVVTVEDNRFVLKGHTKEQAEAHKRYEKLHNKYGGKSMVGNKRRRNTTRKSNQKNKQTMHQMRRAQEKQETLKLIEDDGHIIVATGGNWGRF